MSNYPQYISLAPIFRKNTFSSQSVTVSSDLLQQLSQLPPGGKFLIRNVKPKEGAAPSRPIAYLEYITAEQLADERAKYQEYKASQQSNDSL